MSNARQAFLTRLSWALMSCLLLNCRIMKMESCDPAPRQISADVLPLMAYAGKLFVGLVTTLAWQNTLYEGRNTLQYKDIKAAILSSKIFDYQIDVIDAFDSELAAKKDQQNKPNQLRTILPAPHDMYDGMPTSEERVPTDHPHQRMAALYLGGASSTSSCRTPALARRRSGVRTSRTPVRH